MDILKNLTQMPSDTFRQAFLGGFILALASSLYYVMFGSILGMSGLLSSQLELPITNTSLNKLLVILGLLLSSLAAQVLLPNNALPFDEVTYQDSIIQLTVAGLLVGLGTGMAGGCTSGHGLCGLPRLSLRSFVAVCTFLSVALLTATLGLHKHFPAYSFDLALPSLLSSPVLWLILIFLLTIVVYVQSNESSFYKLLLLLIGGIFGCGLMVSGMSRRSKIYGFLQLDQNWDPSLLVVLMTGVSFNLITFTFMRLKVKQSVLEGRVQDPHGQITGNMVIGAMIFGLGWGIGGLCPGPYMLSLVQSARIAFFWGLPFAIGRKISQRLTDILSNHLKVK